MEVALFDFVAGALSAAAGTVVYTPFHYLQNRTIQCLPISPNPLVWFRGLPILVGGNAPKLGLQMSIYGALKSTEDSSAQNVFAALMAGGASGALNNFSNLIALHQENNGTNLPRTTRQLCGQGLVARGLGTTIAREVLFTNIFFLFLQSSKEYVNGCLGGSPSLAAITSGLVSGGCVAVTTQPFMVVNAKLYADMEKKLYRNGYDAALKIFAEKGIRGFYTGTGYRSIGIILALPIIDYTHLRIAEHWKH